jgi:peptide chain release factor subunit 3
VSKLLVVVNKMDDPTVNWSKQRCFSSLSLSLFAFVFSALRLCSPVVSSCCISPRYEEIESKMIPFLRSSGYNVKKGIGRLFFMPHMVFGFHKPYYYIAFSISF